MSSLSIAFLLPLLAFSQISKEKVCNLHGKVKIVESHANYRVFVESNNPDLNVKIVPAFPNKPGKWQIVTIDQDFSVQFVDNKAMADFTIKFAIFPGC